MDRYETVKLLGQGGEGAALLVKRKEDEQLFVCKKKTYLSIDEANQGLQEAISLARFSSEFVTRYEDLFLQIRREDGVSIFDLNLIMEFCAGGSIWDRLLSAREQSASQHESASELELVPLVLVEKWIVELCRGLKAVHALKVMHRDLKSENIFLTAHDQVKIGDFGLATAARTSHQDHSGTYHYMAPEVQRKQPHNSKADIWSLACILFEASTAHLLPVDEIDWHRLIDQGGADLVRHTLAKHFPKDREHIRRLVEYMMEIDPLQRPNIDQVLEHEFFRQYTLQSEKAKALKQLTFDKLADSVKDGLSRQLNKRDVDASLDLLARELRDEPRMLYLFTKDADKRLKLTRNVVLNYLVRYCAKKGNNLWGRYSPSGQLQAVALWLPPDRTLRPSFAQIIRVGMQNFGKIGVKTGTGVSGVHRVNYSTGVKIGQFGEFFEKVYQQEVPENSWILSYLAVDRELHGKGIGRHLLSHVFTVADYHGQDCVTICFDGQGVDFFLKVGFTLLKTIAEPIKKSTCPPAQLLIRRPRVDMEHALSSLALLHSSSSELSTAQSKDTRRHSKHAL